MIFAFKYFSVNVKVSEVYYTVNDAEEKQNLSRF